MQSKLWNQPINQNAILKTPPAAASATCSSRNNNIEDNNNALGPSIQSMSMWASGNVMLAQLPCFRPSCPLKKPTHFLMHLGKRR